jgi:phosphoglycolate phosphatase
VALKKLGRPPLDLPSVVSFIGDGVERLVERCLIATGGSSEPIKAQALAYFLDAYEKDMTTLTRPYPGVVDCLQDLKQAGVKLGICTNKPSEAARAICKTLGLADYFEVIAGAEPGQPKKPDARPLLDCIAALGGTADRSIYVGDSAVDFHTARNARVRFHFFTGGYLNSELPDFPAGHAFDEWAKPAISNAIRAL